jgi:hypothetical protein
MITKPNCLKVKQVLTEAEVDVIINKIKEIEEPRWFTRKEFAPGRGMPGSECRYDYCNQIHMSKEIVAFLKEYAPVYNDFFLGEVAVNRYNEGDFIGPHKDRDMYRRNMVISLQENGDGLLLDESNEFIEDRLGQGVIIDGVGPVHSVPSVKQERYSLIFLYE